MDKMKGSNNHVYIGSLVDCHESIHLFHVVLLNTEDHIIMRVYLFIVII